MNRWRWFLLAVLILGGALTWLLLQSPPPRADRGPSAAEPPETPPRARRAAQPPPARAKTSGSPDGSSSASVDSGGQGTAPPRRPPAVHSALPRTAADTAPIGERARLNGVTAVVSHVQACFKERIKRGKRLSGRFVVRFTLVAEGGLGRVVDSSVSTSTFRDSALERCATRSLASIKFAAPGRSGRLVVQYPFVFGRQP